MAKMEKCSRCKSEIKMMCRKGTGQCSTNCAEGRGAMKVDRQYAMAA